MLDKGILVFVVVLVFVCLAAGVYGWMGGRITQQAYDNFTSDSWEPRSYVLRNGNCYVEPQGDPLYDQHYAQEVNPQNCAALKTQSEARNIDAQTRAIDQDTGTGKVYTWTFLLTVLAIIAFFLWVLFH